MKRIFTATILAVLFCLCSIGFSSEIDALIKDLGNKDKAKNASVELAKIGKPAVPALIKALGENDKYTKRYAARALREMGEDASDSIPALSKAIKDSDSQTREYAVESLGNMVNEAEQVIPVLKKATKDSDNDVKKKAKEALKKLQSSSSEQTDGNGQSENTNASSAQNVLKDSVPLDKGIYGVPFNATIDEILVWCKDNNMVISIQ
jgi:HEAT repeat protein